MNPCSLPEATVAGYCEVIKSLADTYTAVLYVGKKIISSLNHMIICKQKIVAPNVPEHLVKVVINSAHITGKWILVSIEQIV